MFYYISCPVQINTTPVYILPHSIIDVILTYERLCCKSVRVFVTSVLLADLLVA